MKYELYNREERHLCTHLFRLLHEPADENRCLRSFVGEAVPPGPVSIFSEAALIRDAYVARKPDITPFMTQLVVLVARQEAVTTFTGFPDLPDALRDPRQTHPKQIRYKAGKIGHELVEGDARVYGAIQGMFNAKPDLAVCLERKVVVYEAKFTMPFDTEQLVRTRHIADVWAKLLHEDLGYEASPDIEVRTLGLAKHGPDVSWESLVPLAASIYPEDDPTRRAIADAVASFG